MESNRFVLSELGSIYTLSPLIEKRTIQIPRNRVSGLQIIEKKLRVGDERLRGNYDSTLSGHPVV